MRLYFVILYINVESCFDIIWILRVKTFLMPAFPDMRIWQTYSHVNNLVILRSQYLKTIGCSLIKKYLAQNSDVIQEQ
jgi:hypothetical protein